MSKDNLEAGDLQLALKEGRAMVEALEILTANAGLEVDAGPGQRLGHLPKGERRSLLMDVRRSARIVESCLRPRRYGRIGGGCKEVGVWHPFEAGA